jgi:cytochrome c5
MKAIASLTIIVLAALLVGCGDPSSSGSGGIAEVKSRELQPGDPEIAEIYNRSCRSCHTVAATGAPLTGDTAAWAPLMAKGADILLENVVSGYRGMPPFGLCMDCDADQFDALIAFMASAGEDQ